MKSKKTRLRAVIFKISIMVFLVVSLNCFYNWKSSSMCLNEPLENNSYYKYERYLSSKDYSRNFYKKYYHEDSDDFFVDNCNYTLVEDNVEKINNHISNFLKEFKEVDNNVDFNYDVITSDDYYYLIKEKWSNREYVLLYYYDIDEHILYETSYIE